MSKGCPTVAAHQPGFGQDSDTDTSRDTTRDTSRDTTKDTASQAPQKARGENEEVNLD